MKKKTKIRAGLQFGISMSIFSIIQNLWSHDTLTTKIVITSIILGLFQGVVTGVLFGWLMGLFAKSKFVNQSTKIETTEPVVFETGANHFKGIEAVGGKLYLTSKQLIFKSHSLNIQNHQFSINLSDIENVERHKTAGLINNGLLISTINNTKEKFVVEEPDKWLRLLEDQLQTAQV